MHGGRRRWLDWGVWFAARAAIVAACTALLIIPARPAPAAYASIVIDATTGAVLQEKNADKRRYPASLTKMMTLYLTFDALEAGRLSLDTRLPVSRRAAGQPPSRLGVNAGSTITVENAILALATKSANDVATVLAEGLGGTESEFALKMTDKARALGMSETTFRNASGLHNRRQVTTARDMATLARALIRDHPEYYHYFGTRTFTYNGHTFPNHNRMLRSYDGLDGIKTGYVRASGFNLAASALRSGRRLIGVVMGGRSPRSRNREMARLLDTAFLGSNALSAALQLKPALGPDGRVEPAYQRPVADAKAGEAAAETWGIQVGAFSRFAPAHLAAARAARTAPRLLHGAQMAVVPVEDESAGRTIYRARLVGLDEPTARHACERLTGRDLSCIAVPPGENVAIAFIGAPPEEGGAE